MQLPTLYGRSDSGAYGVLVVLCALACGFTALPTLGAPARDAGKPPIPPMPRAPSVATDLKANPAETDRPAAADEASPEALAARARALREAAEKGDAESQVRLGLLYQAGEGVPADDAEALKWYRKAADAGHIEGMWRLGGMYLLGSGTAADEREGLRWSRKAAEAGPADLQCKFAGMLERGEYVRQDYDEALTWYRRAAEGGNARAMACIGLMYTQGLGVPKSDRDAAAWYRRGAEAGDEMGMGLLADAYANGWGIEKDDGEAVTWYRKAVAGGYTPSLCRLGVMYFEGRSVPQSDAEAMAWWLKAAETGDAEAMARLGLMHEQGRGVPQDDARAAEWFLKAARHGDAFAMRALGIAYAEGSGVVRDLAEAALWMHRAAEAGDAEAREWFTDNATALAAIAARDPNSELRFPPVMGTLRRGTITDHESRDPGYGTSVGYGSESLQATVYLFTGGHDTVPDGPDSAPVKAAFEEALLDVQAAVRRGDYQELTEFSRAQVFLDPEGRTSPALCARWGLVQKGVRKDSAVYVLGSRNRIVKLRLTSPSAAAPAAVSEHAAFLKAVADWLK